MRFSPRFSVLLLSLFLAGCLGGATTPPLAEKGESTRQKAAQLFRECRTQLALVEYRKVLHLAQLRDDRPASANALLNIGVIHLVRGELQESAHALQQGQKFFAELQDRQGEQQCATHLAALTIKRGNWQEGLTALQALWPQLGGDEGSASAERVRVLNGMAIAYKESGQLAEAKQCLHRAEQEATALQRES
uniref:hypothetical protein n=1 Tax=Candidatus Magnetaquicoccus inordinatus TaxID=2496818 RepID=UPI00102AA1F4